MTHRLPSYEGVLDAARQIEAMRKEKGLGG